MKTRKTSQRIITMVVGVTAGILAIILVNGVLYPDDAPENKINTEINNMVNEMNSAAPIMINNDIRFDSIVLNKNNKIGYYYTMVNTHKDSVDIVNFEQQYRSALANNIKTKESMGIIRKQQFTVLYYYNDKNGALFSTITISPEMYM